MNAYRPLLIFTALLFNSSGWAQQFSPIFSDADNDKMDDYWEYQYGLDSTNPKDAWGDWDGDHILNIHEFYLESSPIDASSPQAVEVPDIISKEFIAEQLLKTPPNGRLVLRFRDGVYLPRENINFQKAGIKLFLQGGWSADFKEHNPKKYKTIFDGSEGILNWRIKAFGPQISIILDNLTMRNGSRPLYVSGGGEFVYFGMYNCQLLQNGVNSTSPNLYFSLGNKIIIDIVNSNISNNHSDGIHLFVRNAHVSCRILNTIISGNNVTGSSAMFLGYNIYDSQINIDFVNSILYDNGPSQICYWGNDQDKIKVTSSHSNIEYSVDNSQVEIEFIENNINVNPLFTSAQSNEFQLLPNSPCIDKGIDIGLPFNGAAPDMGAFEFGEPEVIPIPLQDISFKVFPSPTRGPLYFEFSILSATDLTIDIYTASGTRLRNVLDTYLDKGEYQFKIDAANFPAGIYFAKYTFGQTSKIEKFVVGH